MVVIIFSLVFLCSALFLVTFFLALLSSIRLTNYIKKENYQLWVDDRKKRTVGIPSPFHGFNPLSLPEEYNNISEVDFIKLKNSAQKNCKLFLVCFGAFAVSIVCAIITMALYSSNI
jgi:hypothetical protein